MRKKRVTKHPLPDCMLVWYFSILADNGKGLHLYGDRLCEQGWADLRLDGINKETARRVYNKI